MIYRIFKLQTHIACMLFMLIALNVNAGEKRISWHTINAYGFDEIEEIMHETTNDIITEGRQHLDKIPNIEVIGYSDRLGKRLSKDKIAFQRSETIASYLKARLLNEFGDMEVSFYSGGVKFRGAVVKWSFIEKKVEVKEIIILNPEPTEKEMGEASQNIVLADMKLIQDKGSNFNRYKIVAFCAAIGFAILLGVFLNYNKKSSLPIEQSKNTVIAVGSAPKTKSLHSTSILINNQWYEYTPIMVEGEYASLHTTSDGTKRTYKTMKSLRKSIKNSFKKNPKMIKEEKKAGRLIPIK